VAEADPETYVGRWALAAIDDGLRSAVETLSDARDRLDAFSRFADIEQRIEGFEDEVRPLLIYVDRMVDAEIDRLRGK
jgi:hypothetical protein